MDGPLGDEGSPSVLRIEEAFFCQLGNRFAHSLTADMVLFGEHVLRRDFIAGVPCSADDFLFYFVFYVTEFGFFHIGSISAKLRGLTYLRCRSRGNVSREMDGVPQDSHPSPDIRYVMYGSLDIGSTKIYNLIFYSSDIFYQVHPLTNILGISIIAQCS